MRTTILCILLFCAYALDTKAQTIEPEVSENVELMSILARMAGYPEYNMDMAGQYIKDMDEYFKSQTKHPAVQYMKELRNKNGISFDAVMSMAIHLNNQNGTFSLIDEEVPTLEKRWDKVDKAEFLTQLGRFYKDSRFNDFFNAHKTLYEKGLEAYRENVIKYLDTSWYSDFYGKEPQETFSVIIGFCNGGGNYGVNRHVKGNRKEVFAVVGYYVDKDNRPMYSKDYLPTLVHEFNHSFVNYLLDEKLYPGHVKDMEQAATDIFELSKWAMVKQAYGNWKTMINESLVRAAVICYMLDKDYRAEDVRQELSDQIQRNFRWMPELVSLLRKYEKKQHKYGNFESFYPHIITFFSDVAKKENEQFKVLTHNRS